jgi:hypothetical protein
MKILIFMVDIQVFYVKVREVNEGAFDLGETQPFVETKPMNLRNLVE